jgi:hypothetical protein
MPELLFYLDRILYRKECGVVGFFEFLESVGWGLVPCGMSDLV